MTTNTSARNADLEHVQFHDAIRSLQKLGAANRCFEIVARRAPELSRESRGQLNQLVKRVTLPSWGKGRAPLHVYPKYAATDKVFERHFFPTFFQYWEELHSGPPESVLEVAQKVAPDVDFASAEWSRIVEKLPTIASRLTRISRADLTLALFAYRYRGQRCAGRHGTADGPSPDSISLPVVPEVVRTEDLTTVAEGSADPKLVATHESVPALHDSDAEERREIANVEMATRHGEQLRSQLDSTLQHLRRVEPANRIWDSEIPDFVRQLESLTAEKLQARAELSDRQSLAMALGELQLFGGELEFLALATQCGCWSSEAAKPADVRRATEATRELASLLQKHRDARAGAQKAISDEELEAQTRARQSAKGGVLALVAELNSLFRPKHEDFEAEPLPSARVESAPNGPPSIAFSPVATAFESPEVPEVVESSGRASCEPDSGLPRGTFVDEAGPPAEAPSSTPPPIDAEVESSVAESAPRFSRHRSAAVEATRATLSASDDVGRDTDASEPNGSSLATPAKSVNGLTELGVPASGDSSSGVPDVATTFDAYRGSHWVDFEGNVRKAPWTTATFGGELLAAAIDALASGPGRAWRLLLLVRALEHLGLEPPVRSIDLSAATDIWLAPDSRTAGNDPARCERARAAPAFNATTADRLGLVLEALRPSLERHLLAHEIDPLIEHASFESGALRVVVHRLLGAHAVGQEPIVLLRQQQRAEPDSSPQLLVTRFGDARRDLQTLVTRNWSGAGGRVQRRHCRHAWSEFIERVQPVLGRLYPPPRGDDDWTVAEALHMIEGFNADIEGLCDKYEAMFDDRRHMLRAATEIADAARQVIELRRRQLMPPVKRPVVALPLVEIEHLRTARLEAPVEEFGRQLLIRVVDMTPRDVDAPHPLAITTADLCAYPDLLRVINGMPAESASALRTRGRAFAYASDVVETIQAAAVILQRRDVDPDVGLQQLVETLVNSHRTGLLGSIVHVLDERLQHRVYAENADRLNTFAGTISQISKAVDDLAQLGNPHAGKFREIRESAIGLIEGGRARIDATLLDGWLEHAKMLGTKLISAHVTALEAQAARRDEREEICNCLARGHYGRAVRILSGSTGADLKSTRQTEWRDDIRETGDSLRQRLHSSDSKLRTLLDRWRNGLKGDTARADRTLRTEFVRLLTDDRNMDRDSNPAHIAIPVSTINTEFVRDQVMPTWMPQLSRFGRVVILTPPVVSEHPSFRQGTLGRAAEYPHDLAIFLAPRLSTDRRAEVLAELRRRGSAAAIIDDVDLLRLTNPGGERPHMMLGLLELVLEQQSRGAYSPFELPEGSHMRLEMYVGRRDKARELARTANYSRLFSGRKLGKSALLRFIERTEDGTKLPSGNVLRVIYVPAAGIESEHAMVDAILGGSNGRLAFGSRRDWRLRRRTS